MGVYVDKFYEVGERYRDVTLYCDECGVEGFPSTRAGDSRKAAKKDGWLRKLVKGEYVDICPDCQKDQK